jgi:hypothetical protein
MATTQFLQLDGGKGLMQVLLFSGLSHPMLVHPIVHGEPVLTAQAFYYLEQLEAVAKVRFETPADHLKDGEVEYLVDNYLFEYSKFHPESRLSFKIAEGIFWEDDVPEFYLLVDHRDTEVLVLDIMNDEHVYSIEAIDPSDRVDLNDWDIGRNFAREAFEPYQAAMGALLEKKVKAFVAPSEDRSGYMGKLRVIKSGYGLITREQAERLSDISLRSISPATTSVKLAATNVANVCKDLPLKRIVSSKQYSPIMLSHYFSGLKELNPLKAFVGFYNVLEYYFEEAPRILGRSASTELPQLKCVIELISTAAEVENFFLKLPEAVSHAILADFPTSSGEIILRVTHTQDLRQDLARWLYEIRCAVIHSKKTRRGVPTPSFEPYSQSSNVVRIVIPIIQWLAVRCIEKDHDLTNAVLPTV